MTGRVDMLTSPVAAARAAAATGAYLIRGGVGDQALFFTHPPKDLKKKKKMTNDPTELVSWYHVGLSRHGKNNLPCVSYVFWYTGTWSRAFNVY